MSGIINVMVDNENFSNIGKRLSLWEGKPEGVYVGKDSNVSFTAKSDNGAEIYVAGGKIEKKFPPFNINQNDLQQFFVLHN